MTITHFPRRASQILCCGEALIDMLPAVTASGANVFKPSAGGAVFNTALALGRLGASVGYFGGLSSDMFGDQLVGALTNSNVDTSLCRRVPRPTTLAFVSLRDGQARYAFYDENTAGRTLSRADLPEISVQIDALFFGGISLATQPCADTYETLMMRYTRNRVIMLDPNIRPGFIADEPAYRARLSRMIGASDIVKVSDEDLRWIMGPGAPRDQARILLTLGPKLVLLSEGRNGATAFCATGAFHAPARSVGVVDTVGAGDTFNAGVLYALGARGALSRRWIDSLAKTDQNAKDTLIAALEMGCGAAAVTVSRAGANPPMLAEIS